MSLVLRRNTHLTTTMSDTVKADGIVIYHKLGVGYYPIACGTTASITTTTDKIELAPYTNGKWRAYEYGRTTGTISSSGLIKIDAGGTAYSPFDLIDYQHSHQKVLTKYTITDPQGNSKTYQANCLIDEVTLNTDAGGVATYTMSMTIASDPTFVQIPVDTGGDNVQAWDYTATGGESSITNVALIGDEVVDVRRNGIGLDVVFTGTPTTNQVLFDDTTGQFTFGMALGADEWILVIYVE